VEVYVCVVDVGVVVVDYEVVVGVVLEAGELDGVVVCCY